MLTQNTCFGENMVSVLDAKPNNVQATVFVI